MGLAELAATAEASAVEIEKMANDFNTELARVIVQNAGLVKALTESMTGKNEGQKKDAG